MVMHYAPATDTVFPCSSSARQGGVTSSSIWSSHELGQTPEEDIGVRLSTSGDGQGQRFLLYLEESQLLVHSGGTHHHHIT